LSKKRVLSGIQPTGKLHLGNLIGALENWVKMQDEFECYFEIADLHGLTTLYDDTKEFRHNILDVASDLISAGIDPERCTLFVQSEVPEHSELHLIFSMITPLSWLERVPTYKSKIDELKEKDLSTYGFLGYPVLQAADILIYKADVVPVGQDQLPHLEITREIARRFNFLYKEVFPVPRESLTQVPILPGLDGRKMSKSYGNTIAISDPADLIAEKVSDMITDPARVKRSDKGHPDICAAYAYHKIFNKSACDEVAKKCKAAEIGCVECKKGLAKVLTGYLAPIRKKREELDKDPSTIIAILEAGAKKARAAAGRTLLEARAAMGLV
jgi:tryptophanyl-tRNA synthetase